MTLSQNIDVEQAFVVAVPTDLLRSQKSENHPSSPFLPSSAITTSSSPFSAHSLFLQKGKKRGEKKESEKRNVKRRKRSKKEAAFRGWRDAD